MFIDVHILKFELRIFENKRLIATATLSTAHSISTCPESVDKDAARSVPKTVRVRACISKEAKSYSEVPKIMIGLNNTTHTKTSYRQKLPIMGKSKAKRKTPPNSNNNTKSSKVAQKRKENAVQSHSSNKSGNYMSLAQLTMMDPTRCYKYITDQKDRPSGWLTSVEFPLGRVTEDSSVIKVIFAKMVTRTV